MWPLHGANLGTLLRTCDAVGACLAVPRLPWVPEALARGNTLGRLACVHWTGRDACGWLRQQRIAGTRIVGVELAEEASGLATARGPGAYIAVLGHEQTGILPEALDLLDVAVEIPMIGSGKSLNVAVAGSRCCTAWPGSCDVRRLPGAIIGLYETGQRPVTENGDGRGHHGQR